MANEQITALLIGQLETRTKTAGRSVRSTANVLRTIASQLREDDTARGAAHFTDRGADLVDRAGAYLEQSDFQTLISDAEDFSRERPWAVASLGLVTGLLASRLLKSTAARRHALVGLDSSLAPDGATDDAAARARTVPADGI
jgi:ElaB/YqjD/DUF883 family membrane-anchored ribosome-binding protein